jgi:1-acyl-sn-glycerol-3-phosphate acyltransferase
MGVELWRRRGIRLRGLGDHGHYRIPVWRNLLERSGMVRGTRENVRALMRDGQHILVFPGGTGEVFHGRGQKYQLLWKERVGFARLAIEFGYPIVPFAAVGAEEMFDIVADQRSPGLAQVYAIISRLVGLPLPPIARGIGPSLIPRPERLYFWFGEPIDTARFDGRGEDDDAARQLRDEVRVAVQSGIEFLLAEREADPRRGVIQRMLHTPAPPVADPDAHFVAHAFDAMNEAGAETAAAWMSRWVQLEDPPGWPGEGVWRGRAAVIARLDEVIAELGAVHVSVEDARSVGEGVLTLLALLTRDSEPLQFYAAIEIDGGQIIRIRVLLDEQAARVALSEP